MALMPTKVLAMLGIEIHDSSDKSKILDVDVSGLTTETTRTATFPDRDVAIADSGAAVADPGDAGAIPITRSGYCPLVSAGAETRTLAAAPFLGQMLTLYFQTDGGNCVVTVASPVNETGNNTITFADANESVTLLGVNNGVGPAWRVLQSDFNTGGLSTV